MAHYRLYCLDDASKMESGDWIEAKNDDEAIVLARAMKLTINCEIWDGNRLVARIRAHAPA